MYLLYSDGVWKYNFINMKSIYPNKMEDKIPMGNIKDTLFAFVIIIIIAIFSRIIGEEIKKQEDFIYVFKNKEEMEKYILTQELKR